MAANVKSVTRVTRHLVTMWCLVLLAVMSSVGVMGKPVDSWLILDPYLTLREVSLPGDPALERLMTSLRGEGQRLNGNDPAWQHVATVLALSHNTPTSDGVHVTAINAENDPEMHASDGEIHSPTEAIPLDSPTTSNTINPKSQSMTTYFSSALSSGEGEGGEEVQLDDEEVQLDEEEVQREADQSGVSVVDQGYDTPRLPAGIVSSSEDTLPSRVVDPPLQPSQDLLVTVHTQDPSMTVHTQDPSLTVHTQDPSLTVQTQDPSLTVHTQDPSMTVHTQDPSLTAHTQDPSLTVYTHRIPA